MDKLWIVLLFLGVFFIGRNVIKHLVFRYLASSENKGIYSPDAFEKTDSKIFWEEEGKRRDFEQAEFVLPEEDFFENERTEFSENFEKEFENLSEEEAKAVLEEAELLKKDGESE